MLGLEEDFIQRHGTVSYEVACTMVQAVLTISSVDVALSTTGLAGPEGDDRGTPVGTVWIGIAQKGQKPDAQSFYCTGSRNEIRNTVVHCAIEILLQVLK
jgi:PncC family amidohydrolase